MQSLPQTLLHPQVVICEEPQRLWDGVVIVIGEGRVVVSDEAERRHLVTGVQGGEQHECSGAGHVQVFGPGVRPQRRLEETVCDVGQKLWMKEQETFRRFTSKIQPRFVSLVLSKGNSLPPCGGGEHDIVSVLRRDEDVRHRRTLWNLPEAVSTVQTQSILHGVGGEAIERDLRPDVFLKAFNDRSVHSEDQVMAVDNSALFGASQDPSIPYHSTADTPVIR